MFSLSSDRYNRVPHRPIQTSYPVNIVNLSKMYLCLHAQPEYIRNSEQSISSILRVLPHCLRIRLPQDIVLSQNFQFIYKVGAVLGRAFFPYYDKRFLFIFSISILTARYFLLDFKLPNASALLASTIPTVWQPSIAEHLPQVSIALPSAHCLIGHITSQ